jgi:hypothetical protein
MEHGNKVAYRVRALDGVAKAHPIALACMESPEARNRWTVRLLADARVSLGYVNSCSKSTARATLKRKEPEPRLNQYWCIPPKANAEFVAPMEKPNTHHEASLFAVFEPEIARHLAARCEIHYTPELGSWLEMAEIESRVPSRICMNDHSDSREKQAAAIAELERSRNEKRIGIG